MTAFLAIAAYGAWWAYGYYEYKQHLPINEITVNNIEREYHTFVPVKKPDGPAPLLVLLQGGSVGSWRFAQQHRWEMFAEDQGIIIAVPVGKRLPPNEGAWQLNTTIDSMQDVDFFNAMLDEVSAEHDIDTTRVYAVGYSLGSMFSYELACQMSSRFAAIASHAGTMPVTPKSCVPERNVPIMHLHGVQDPIIAYDNAWNWKSWDSVGTMRDVPGLLNYWRDKYNCQNETRNETDLGAHIIYGSCDQEVRVEHHRIEEGGHDWPESIDGVSTHVVIWSFLSEFATD